SVFIEQLARQRARRCLGRMRRTLGRTIAQLPLNALPQLAIHYRFVLAGVTLLLVANLANVDRVGKQLVQGAAREGLTSRALAARGYPDLGDDTTLVEIVPEQPDAAQLQVALIDVPDGLGLDRVDHQTAIANVVAQRCGAAHPHSLALGSCDFVPDPLSGDL